MSLIKYRKQFWSNGYVLLKDFFNNKEAHNIKLWANHIQQFPEQRNKWMVYKETDTDITTRVEYFKNYYQPINKFIRTRLNPVLNEVYGNDMTLFKDKINWKHPNSKGFGAHQDQPAWCDFPADRFVTLALFADNSTIENGCLEFVKERHTEGLFSHDLESTGAMSSKVEDTFKWEPIQTTPKDILIFDSYAPHRSGPNNSDKSRRIFYFTFNKISDGLFYEEYNKKKRIEFPPDIEREGHHYNNLGNKYNLANPIK